ncbi:hypothetical protein MNB_SM-4-10 [hydrothermal vent metagenome]|uniref:Uncharacterized protein n=1 Tax=hydrothermal vent metagenome TaxID=652676 RepID=A0A1W1BSW7_9ZZZZ
MQKCKELDPLIKLKPFLDKVFLEKIEEQVIQEITQAVNFAKASPEPSLTDLHKYSFTNEGLKHAL